MKPSLGIRRRLNTLGNLGNNELDLSETALILAKIERPGANTAIYKRHLKKLTADVANYANKDANDERVGLSTRIESLRQIVAKRYGYCGNDAAYENFESSNLMRVIDRRCGLPTLLGIIYLHIGRSLGWTIVGLKFPARFLLRIEFNGVRKILDPFDKLIALEPNDLRSLYKSISGPAVELQPDHTKALSNREIILRSKRNAKNLYLRSGDLVQAHDVVETLLLVAPKNPTLWRESGILNARLDRIKEAINDLERFLKLTNTDISRYRTTVLLQELQNRLNQGSTSK